MKAKRTYEECLEKMEKVAEKFGLPPDDIHHDYSGRFMYGSQCVAFEFDSRREAEAFALHFERLYSLTASVDDFGLGYIVYSTCLTFSPNND